MKTNKTEKPTHTPETIRLDDDEREYCAEMGFDWAEKDAFLQRKAEAIQSSNSVIALPCGCALHENGGPSDYDCRNDLAARAAIAKAEAR